MMMKQLVFTTLIGSSFAACPNSCSNRGDCGADDVCTCYHGWIGGDCSLRQCPYGPSWTVTSQSDYDSDLLNRKTILSTPGGFISDDNDIKKTFEDIFSNSQGTPAFRKYTECSSRGNCNYATGICNCFSGYEGRGCRRSSCPNGCSGHGKCLLNSEITNQAYKSDNIDNFQFWDQDRTQQCKCDRGYGGWDCSERSCPMGDNPVSHCPEGRVDDYQLVYVSTTGDDAQYFSLTFTDGFNGKWTTRPIDIAGCEKADEKVDDKYPPVACPEIQEALMDLPNFAIPDIEVDEINLPNLPDNEHAYLVHFTSPSTPGKQNSMGCEVIADPSVDGAAPKYNPVDACFVFHVGNPEWYHPDGTDATFMLNGVPFTRDNVLPSEAVSGPGTTYKEFVPCSSSGTCNKETGTCRCREGTTGQGCREATTFA